MTNVKSRLWGEWEASFYPSGTTIVALRTRADKPHLYVYADVGVSEDRTQGDRYEMCRQLAEFLNGGAMPAWLDDMKRVSERKIVSLSGADISAVGPMFDREPPKLLWCERDDDEANNYRATLINVVTGIR